MMTKEQLESVVVGYNCLEINQKGTVVLFGALVGRDDAYKHKDNHFTGLWYVLDGPYPLVSSDWGTVEQATMLLRGGDEQALHKSINFLAKLTLTAWRLQLLTSIAPIDLVWYDKEEDVRIGMKFICNKVGSVISDDGKSASLELSGFDLTNGMWRDMKLDDIYHPCKE